MLILPSTLTSREARDTLRLLRRTLQAEGADGPVLVDAGRLQHLDSAALAVLLELDRLASAWGRGFEVRNAPAKLTALGKLYGVDALLWHGAPAAPSSSSSSERRDAPLQRSPAV